MFAVRTAARRAVVTVLALAVAAAGCTGGDADDPASEGAEAPAASESVDGDGAGSEAAGGGGAFVIVLAPGAEVDVDQEVLDAAERWIAEESGLSAMLQEEIFLSTASRTRDVTHLTFVQQHGEVSVRGAQFIVHVRDGGEVLGASQSLVETLPGEGVTEELTAEEALEIAVKAVPGEIEGDPQVAPIWLEAGLELRLGWEVQATTSAPPAAWAVVVDATDGAVLSVDRLSTDRGTTAAPSASPPREVAQAAACDAPPPPSACIFVVDPIYAAGIPSVPPGQANQTLVGVPLSNLLDPSSPDLIGRYAQIAPAVAPLYADADGVWGQQGRGGQDITFEAGMTYYWVDYTQQVLQELGYDYHADDPVDLVPIEPGFPDNAFYTFVEDRIHMGAGRDGVNEAEDAQGIIHEYGHAILQAAVPNIVTEEGGAFHESFGDLVSIFTTLEFRNGDIGCLFHWAEQGNCIRRVDTDLVYPDDLRFEVHLDGEIYNGAVWAIFEAVLQRETGLTPEGCQDRATNPCDAVRDQVYGTLLGSLPFLTPTLTLDDAATAFAVSDQTFYGGANAEVIQQVFGERGLAANGTPSVQVQGLMDFERSRSVAAVKITHPFRGDLAVSLEVIDGAGEPLCGADLVQPSADDGDNITGRFDLVGTDCEPFLPPGPEQVWLLHVVDTGPEDEGMLFQFAVSHEGQRFIAAGLPAVIPDADAIGLTAAIGGSAPTAMVPTDSAMPGGGSVTALVDVQHPYRGDLEIQVAVVDPQAETVLCRVDLLAADPSDDGDDVALEGDVSACGAFHPPGPSQVWVLRVADLAAADVGTVLRFALVGPDGTTLEADVAGAAGAIPDADAEGLIVPILG
jgi:subtilisin-like proprotein convertase family protein